MEYEKKPTIRWTRYPERYWYETLNGWASRERTLQERLDIIEYMKKKGWVT